MNALSQLQARSVPRLCFRLLAPARRIALNPRPYPTCPSLHHRPLLPRVFPTVLHHQHQHLAPLHRSVLHQQRLSLRLYDFSCENQHSPEGRPVVRQHVLMSQQRSFRLSPERGSQKRAVLKFIIKIITKVIVLLFHLIGRCLEELGLEVGTWFEKLKVFHEYLKASDGLMGKAYCYVVNYLSKKLGEIFELLMDKTTGKAVKFAKTSKIIQKVLSMWKKYANSKEEEVNSKEKEEKKEEEQFTKEKKEEHGKESNQEEKNPNKKGRILIELYDIEKIDDILKSEVWQTIKSSNVGAVKVEKRD